MVISKTGSLFLFVGVLCGAVACDVESTAEDAEGLGSDDDGDDDSVDDDGDDDSADDDGDDDTADDDGDDDASDDTADAGPDADDAGAPPEPPLVCPDGITVALSDFFSSQVALGTVEGETQVQSLISTGSSETQGLAFALSGDIAVPGEPPTSGRIVIVDRWGTNVITWIDPETAAVLGQLSVGTGFESNPQDYVEIGDGLALVSRIDLNLYPGNEDFDRGSDVLVIDTEAREIVDAIELPIEDDLPPGPSAMMRLGDQVLVNLERYSADYTMTGEAMWAAISVTDPDLLWVEPLPGLKDCGRPVLSPDGTKLAMACTGRIEGDGSIEDIDQSAILLFDPSQDPPVEVARFSAEDLVGEPLQDNLAFVSDDHLLFKTQTPYGGTTNNRVFSFQLSTEAVTELFEARPDPATGGKGIVFGAIRCAPGCTDVCLMTDSDRGVLQRFRLTGTGVKRLSPIEVEDGVGLPPVGLTYRLNAD